MSVQERAAGVETERDWEPAQITTRLTPGPRLSVERRNSLLAYGLLGAGLLLLSGRFGLFGWAGLELMPGIILGTIASCFLFFAFWQRWYPMLIPGSVLAGLALGVPLAPLMGGTSVLWGLALGFLAIYKLGREYFGETHPWPIYPAVPLFGVGLIVALAQVGAQLSSAATLWIPLLLIGAGLLYFTRRKAA